MAGPRSCRLCGELRIEGDPVKLAPLCAIVVGSFAAFACTQQQAYYSGQAWQRNQCNKLMDQSEREHCMSKTNTRYEDYKRQTESGDKP